jgi:3-deoxy-D-arabino-heptulosonate 7-phosphate (DAHP) synthase class II
MPVEYYPNKSAEELLAILEKLQARQTAGTITEFSAAGVRTVKTVAPGTARIETEIKRVLYSLFLRDGTTYANPYAQQIKRTRVRYTQS